MTLDITPLHRDFGVRIDCIDTRRPVDDATARELLWAFEEFSLIYLPGQDITSDQQVAFGQIFGDVEPVKVGSLGAGTLVSPLTNILTDGGLAPPNHKQALTMRANQLWHSDGSYKRDPPLASAIVAHVVPPEGGETEFVSMRSVYEALPAGLRHSIEAMRSIHSYATSRDSIRPGLASAAERHALPAVDQPLITVNPVNGRKAVYLGSHTSHIIGMAAAESARTIKALLTHASDPRLTYRHRWAPHDLILWDNRCINHRGRPWDMEREPRLLTHIAIATRK